jgi:hypothetical protein
VTVTGAEFAGIAGGPAEATACRAADAGADACEVGGEPADAVCVPDPPFSACIVINDCAVLIVSPSDISIDAPVSGTRAVMSILSAWLDDWPTTTVNSAPNAWASCDRLKSEPISETSMPAVCAAKINAGADGS